MLFDFFYLVALIEYIIETKLNRVCRIFKFSQKAYILSTSRDSKSLWYLGHGFQGNRPVWVLVFFANAFLIYFMLGNYDVNYADFIR